ncbi:hypothetical protein CJF31_00003591 [Rutstroemia sp. NJR-2017a BVV2]|nr:hypothetical protein CJF31_00003591 [Rutstroemia sp. NJR-2017a BVV2]
MQAQYRSYQQQTPSRTAHGNAGNRRGIGPMVAQGRDPREVMSATQQAQQALMEKKQKEAAKKRAREPTDKNIPDGVEDVIIGDGVQRYKELRDIERRLDATMTRKRLDIREAVDRNVKSQYNTDHTQRHRTLRIWISNTVEDQPWQSDTLDSRTKDGVDQNVEWKKPSPAPNLNGLPAAADFDQLEFKRGGDENCNIVINLVRDETPERFQLSPYLAAILDTNVGTREEVTMGIWSYIKAMGLADDDEKRTFELDDRLRPLFPRQEKGYWPQLGDAIISHTTILQPVRLNYTIRVDKEFHENPQPTIYDVQVTVEDPLRAALEAATKNPDYASSLLEISNLDKQLAILVRAISNSKSKHAFLDALSKNPTEFIKKWISSQKRDLEILAGDGMRGGGEDATNDEWRRGGTDGIWGTPNVKEIASLMVATGRVK